LYASRSGSFEADPAKGRRLHSVPQNIAEFWNVATRPADQNGLGLSHEEALQEVASIEKLLTLLPDIPAIYAAWKEIVSDHRVQGETTANRRA